MNVMIGIGIACVGVIVWLLLLSYLFSIQLKKTVLLTKQLKSLQQRLKPKKKSKRMLTFWDKRLLKVIWNDGYPQTLEAMYQQCLILEEHYKKTGKNKYQLEQMQAALELRLSKKRRLWLLRK
jgi:hypothetical protein